MGEKSAMWQRRGRIQKLPSPIGYHKDCRACPECSQKKVVLWLDGISAWGLLVGVRGQKGGDWLKGFGGHPCMLGWNSGVVAFRNEEGRPSQGVQAE
jgi:hypothetical protein